MATDVPSTIVFMHESHRLSSNSDIVNEKKTQFRMVKKRVKRIIDELKRDGVSCFFLNSFNFIYIISQTNKSTTISTDISFLSI